MGIIEPVGDIVKAMIPPKTNDLDAQQRWRWMVFMSLIALASGFSLHIALACGYLQVLFPGFASAADTQKIQQRLDVVAGINLEREMRYKEQQLCATKDERIRGIMNDDIAKLQREYFDIAKHYYVIPGCDQL